MCGYCGDRKRWPCAKKYGEPHMHICGCGHRWVAPLSKTSPPCPGCTDENGRSAADRQSLRLARSLVQKYGIDAVMAIGGEKRASQQTIRSSALCER